MLFRSDHREGSRLLYMAAVSLIVHAMILGGYFTLMTQPFTSRMAVADLPVIRVSMISGAEAEKERSEQAKLKFLEHRKHVMIKVPESEAKHENKTIAPEKIPDASEKAALKPQTITILAETPSRGADAVQGAPDHAAKASAGDAPGGKEEALAGAVVKKVTVETIAGTGVPAPVLPRYRNAPRPAYPLYARERGHEGLVLISATIRADGRVGEVRIKKSSGFALLDQAALRAVSNWLFEPAKKMNQPVTSAVEIPIRFSLQNGEAG